MLRDAQVSGDNAREVTQSVLLDAGLDPRWCVKMDMAPPATGWLLTGNPPHCQIPGSRNCDRIPNPGFSGFLKADWCKCHLLKAKEVAAAHYLAMNPH